MGLQLRCERSEPEDRCCNRCLRKGSICTTGPSRRGGRPSTDAKDDVAARSLLLHDMARDRPARPERVEDPMQSEALPVTHTEGRVLSQNVPDSVYCNGAFTLEPRLHPCDDSTVLHPTSDCQLEMEACPSMDELLNIIVYDPTISMVSTHQADDSAAGESVATSLEIGSSSSAKHGFGTSTSWPGGSTSGECLPLESQDSVSIEGRKAPTPHGSRWRATQLIQEMSRLSGELLLDVQDQEDDPPPRLS